MTIKLQTRWSMALLMLSAIFAFMWVFWRYLSTDFELFQQIYLRVWIASFLILLLFWKSIDIRKFWQISNQEKLLLFFRWALNYIWVAMFTYAAIVTTLMNVSVVTLIPSITILSILFLWEKLNFLKGLLIWISIIWMFFIGKDSLEFGLWKWEMYALFWDILFWISLLTRRYHSQILSNKELAFGMLASGTITLFILSFIFWEGTISFSNLSNLSVYGIVLLAAFANVCIMILANYWFAHVKWYLADRLLSLEIVFALIFGYMFYRELPMSHEWVWILLIVGSVVYLQKLESNINN